MFANHLNCGRCVTLATIVGARTGSGFLNMSCVGKHVRSALSTGTSLVKSDAPIPNKNVSMSIGLPDICVRGMRAAPSPLPGHAVFCACPYSCVSRYSCV